LLHRRQQRSLRNVREAAGGFDPSEGSDDVATNRSSFDKLQRDRAKVARASAKREKRRERVSEGATEDGEAVDTGGSRHSTAELLQMIEELHRAYDAEAIGYDDFETRKAELLSQLTVD